MSPRNRERRAILSLRKADQTVVGVLTLLGILSVGGHWLLHGGHRGDLIEIDRAEPRHASFQVDVNKADWPEFAQLPEIGETLARRIVESRTEDGPFMDHEDLRRVRGIGPKTLEQLKPYLRPVPASGNVARQ